MEFVWLAVGLVVGALAAWALLSRRVSEVAAEAAGSRASANELRSQIDPLKLQISTLQVSLSKSEREVTAAQTHLESFQKMEATFKTLASEALRSSQADFLKLANEKLSDKVFEPVTKSLDKVEVELKNLDAQRGAIKQQVDSLTVSQLGLQKETGKLAEALKNSSVRGRWGEVQLRRILELSGMLEHCDFTTQSTVATEEGRQRPDVLVKLPGDKTLIVDSKVPLDAFLLALEATTEEERVRLLKKHAQDVRTQVYKLGQKAYFDQFPRSPEFVILFLPGEPFFSAAIEHDPSLFEEAFAKGVILASPTTLIAMLKSVHYGWQQEQMAQNAQRISEAGQELHDRVATLIEHLGRMGKSLGSAVDDFNRTVGSLEVRVLPAAKRLKELGAGGSKELAEIPRIDKAPRAPESSGNRLPAPTVANMNAPEREAS